MFTIRNNNVIVRYRNVQKISTILYERKAEMKAKASKKRRLSKRKL